MSEHIKNSFIEAANVLQEFLEDSNNLQVIKEATDSFTQSLKNGGRLLTCGNGGSMCDSLHFAEELTGRFRKDRPPISAMAMGDPSHLTCVANDYGFDQVFSRNVEAWGRAGDCLLAISTSGNSENVIKAVEKAKQLNIKTIGLLGKGGGKLKELVDFPIIVPSKVADRIQEVHIKVIHIFIEGIERALYPEHYK